MRYVLGFIRFMSGHVRPEERDDFVIESVGRWMEHAWSAVRSAPTAPPDDLNRIFAAVITSKVLGGRLLPMPAHAMLQSWRGGLIGKDWVGPAMPDGNGPLEQWLAPGFEWRSWVDAWRSILPTRTRWSWARRIADQLAAGAKQPELPPYLTPDERQRIGRAFEATDPEERRKVLPVHQIRGDPACPRHGYVLPTSAAHRFRSARIARTECCGAILLNLDLRHVPDNA